MPDPHHSLTARTEVTLGAPAATMAQLCDHFSEHGTVTTDGRSCVIQTAFGTARITAACSRLTIDATGADETALAYVKLSIAEHLLQFAGGDTPRIVWNGDGAAGRPLPYFREMRVARTAFVTPRTRRLTLAGADLERFARGGLHIRLLLAKDRAQPPAWPVTGEDGRPKWPAGAARPETRIYTIRHIDVAAGEVDIDFVMHGDGDMPGARFGAEARPGDVVGMTGPGGATLTPAQWYLFAGDETALPAIARMLEHLPPTAEAVVRMQVHDKAEEQPLISPAKLDLQWLHRSGSQARDGSLADAVRAVRIPGDGRSIFVWGGCEHGDFRAIRAHLRQDLGLSREQHLVAAYWRRGFDGESRPVAGETTAARRPSA